uniref:AAA+ ATPase domain-containing protein n=1 Tax=Bostrychia simpliciuscula TaxID=324754 RepID=A0A1Z1M816_9FLOR|nr:hypothetical protein [Bostrychia simpliciuscula]ARW62110.1 hypothetical protein [Bostrychia simpliciuscula]
MLIADDLDKLLEILPDFVKSPLARHTNKKLLIEVVMDLGRRPEARFPNGPEYLSKINISWHDLDFCIRKLPHFSGDNRSGIECTLHRISSIRNRKGNIVGLTCRVGRAIFGTIGIIRDLLYSCQSILLLGKPGVGKTTTIREITRVLADEMEKRVVIIDTSNEIAGDGDIPHPAIGRARRMQVTRPEWQHQVMIEAVENHMPEVIIIDEIGTELEALAARTIAERGVQLVGTAHGNYLESLIKNPTLSDLIGGVQYVTLGDDEAKRRGCQKSVVERKAVPAFQIAIEIHERNYWIVHEKVHEVVDEILQGSIFSIQSRKIHNDGSIVIKCKNSFSTDFTMNNSHYLSNKLEVKKVFNSSILPNSSNKKLSSLKELNTQLVTVSKNNIFNSYNFKSKSFFNKNIIKLYVYGINIQQIEATINTLQLSIVLTRNVITADSILALRSYIKYNSKIRQIAKSKQIVIYTIYNNTANNIIRALRQILNYYEKFCINWNKLCKNKNSMELNVLLETRFAIDRIIIKKKQSVELLPQIDTLSQLQHKLINMYNLKYSVIRKNVYKKTRIYPN